MLGTEILKKVVLNRLMTRSKHHQLQSDLRDLGLWGLNTNALGHMAVQDVDVVDLMAAYGSPLFVVNQQRLEVDIGNALSALKGLNAETELLYSYKTNCTPGILKEIHKHGVGAEVISHYELWLAARLNVPPDRIVFNGVNKTEESLKMAIDMNILSINIDQHSEIDRIYRLSKPGNRKIGIGVRLGFNECSQFGVEVASGEAMRACNDILKLSDRLELRCIHFNVTSNAKDGKTHKKYAQMAIELMSQIERSTGHYTPCLDIGGGFGVPTTKNMSSYEYGLYRVTGCLPKPPKLSDYQPLDRSLNEILTGIDEACSRFNYKRPKLILEPGRLITSRSQMLLTRINAIKQKSCGTKFVITDAGRLSTTFPCDFEYHESFLANRPEAAPEQLYHIMGRICTSADWLMKNRFLPLLDDRDIIAVMDAGAYFSSYSSNFAFQRPAIVMVNGNDVTVLRDEETFEHITAMDCI